MLSIFSSAYWLAVFPHWKNVNSSPLVTFEFLLLLLLRVLYVFNILIPYQIYDLQILSPILWAFYSVAHVLLMNKFLILMSNLSIFSSVTCASGVIFKKSLPNLIPL